MSNTLGKKSDTAAIAALVGVLPIFVGILAYGWANILKNTMIIPLESVYAQEIQKILQIIVAFFIAIVGVILARAIAAEGKRLKAKDPDASHGTRIAYFVVLILISALGTITTFYRIFEEKNIIVEIAENTKEKLYYFKDDMNNKIKTTKYDAAKIDWLKQKEETQKLYEKLNNQVGIIIKEQKSKNDIEAENLNNIWKQLDNEIKNSQAPGIGEYARLLIKKIQEKLPTWQLQNIGVGFNCTKQLEPRRTQCFNELDQWLVTNYENFEIARNNYINNINQCSINGETLSDFSKLKRSISSIPDFLPQQNCSNLQFNLNVIPNEIEKEFKRIEPKYSPDEENLNNLKAEINVEIPSELNKLDEHLKNTQKISKDESTPILKASWDKYTYLHNKVKNQNIEIDLVKLPNSIADSKIDYLGQITRTLELMAERWNKPITYLIIFLGLIMDLIIISFYSRTISIGTFRNNDDGITDTFNG